MELLISMSSGRLLIFAATNVLRRVLSANGSAGEEIGGAGWSGREGCATDHSDNKDEQLSLLVTRNRPFWLGGGGPSSQWRCLHL
jgi:hypothetical protein